MRSKRSGKRPLRSTRRMPKLAKDWSEFLSLMIFHRVKFLLVGGHAVSIHARPRMTEDLDLFVEASVENAERIRATLQEFRFRSAAPQVEMLG